MNLASGVAYVGGRTSEGWVRMDDEQTGGCRGRRRRRANQNRDFTPWAWLMWTGGWAGGDKPSCSRAA